MKDTLKTWEFLPFYDADRIEARLEKMAAQGWMIQQPTAFRWRWTRMEPKNLHFTVTYFPRAMEMLRDPTPNMEMMEELCLRDGWKLAARWGQMQIFCNERQDPVPIETDPVTQVENIGRAMKKGEGRQYLQIVIFSGLLVLMHLAELHRDPVYVLSSNFKLFMLLSFLLETLGALAHLADYRLWYRRALRSAEQGLWLSHRRNLLPTLLMGAGWLCFAAAILTYEGGLRILALTALTVGIPVAVAVIVGNLMYKRHIPRRKILAVSIAMAIIMTFVSFGLMTTVIIHGGMTVKREPVETINYGQLHFDRYEDEIPLRAEELLGVEAEKWSTQAETEKSVLLTSTEYSQRAILDDWPGGVLRYTVLQPGNHLVYSICKWAYLKNEDETVDGEVVYLDHYEPIDPEPWGVPEVWQRQISDGPSNHFLLCWEDSMAEIVIYNEGQPLTEEQMAQIGNKLAP